MTAATTGFNGGTGIRFLSPFLAAELGFVKIPVCAAPRSLLSLPFGCNSPACFQRNSAAGFLPFGGGEKASFSKGAGEHPDNGSIQGTFPRFIDRFEVQSQGGAETGACFEAGAKSRPKACFN